MTMQHSDMLSTLARTDADAIKAFGETLLDQLGDIEVISSRTGLVMLPMRDTVQGTAFHLGEVLVSEAHIRMGGHEGFSVRRGRDTEAAMAMALVDLAVDAGVAVTDCTEFVARQRAVQTAQDHKTLCQTEATRVEMETF